MFITFTSSSFSGSHPHQPSFPPQSLNAEQSSPLQTWPRNSIRISLCLLEESFLCPISLVLLFWISHFIPHYKLLQEERSSYHVFHKPITVMGFMTPRAQANALPLNTIVSYMSLTHFKVSQKFYKKSGFHFVWPNVSRSFAQKIPFSLCVEGGRGLLIILFNHLFLETFWKMLPFASWPSLPTSTNTAMMKLHIPPVGHACFCHLSLTPYGEGTLSKTPCNSIIFHAVKLPLFPLSLTSSFSGLLYSCFPPDKLDTSSWTNSLLFPGFFHN